MARQALIDRQAALAMMLAGEKDSSIAARFGTSRQAVNLLRKAFLREGILDTGNVKHPQASISNQTVACASQRSQASCAVPVPPSPSWAGGSHPSFEQIADWIVQLIKEAATSRQLREDNAALVSANERLRIEFAKVCDGLRQAGEDISRATARVREYDEALTHLDKQPAVRAPQSADGSQRDQG
jgi:hypothetical protein